MSAYDKIAALYDPWSRRASSRTSTSTSRRRGARRARSSSSASAPDGSRCRSPPRAIRVIGVDSSARDARRVRASTRSSPASSELVDLRARRPARAAGRRARTRSSSARSARCSTWRPTTIACEALARRARAARARRAPRLRRVRARRRTTSSETHGRWLEREPGIFERADWDEDDADAHALRARPRAASDDGARVALAGRVARAARRAGFEVEAPATAGSTAAPTRAARTRSGSPANPSKLRRCSGLWIGLRSSWSCSLLLVLSS